jgi:mannose-6-phosphate isomerase-like protein (cupin superfamily)
MMRVEKGWGYEEIFVSNNRYCGKFLCFNEGKKFSMHFHRWKDETWYVIDGQFELTLLDTEDATCSTKILNVGDVWRNEPLLPHQLLCLKGPGRIVEVSTSDETNDNYRVMPGDSQT